MKNPLRSLFKGRETENSPSEDAPRRSASDAAASDAPAVDPTDLIAVLADLRACMCRASSSSLTEDQIDASLHLYDAGYIDSLTGADLLVHVEARYGLVLDERDLVGKFSCLDALAGHIVASAG